MSAADSCTEKRARKNSQPKQRSKPCEIQDAHDVEQTFLSNESSGIIPMK